MYILNNIFVSAKMFIATFMYLYCNFYLNANIFVISFLNDYRGKKINIMRSHRFKSERKYKKRRVLIATISLVCVAAIIFVGYTLFKPQSEEVSSNTAGASTATPGTSTNSLTPGAVADSTTDAKENTSGSAVGSDTAKPSENNTLKGVMTKDHGFLPTFGSVEKSGKMDELKKLITEFTKKQSGRYGVTFIDLATGETVEVNDKVEYIAASTSKLPMNVLLFKEIEKGNVKLDDILTYKKEDFESGTGIIQRDPFGTQYTVRETSKLAITKSDNCGVNMIIRLLGIENIRQYIMDLGGQVYYGKTHRSCPYDMALVSKDLYNLYLSNEDVYSELIYNLENTDWRDRIDAKLPKDVKVAHKIGNQTRTANDVGIVFASHPYVLSVMTEDVDVGTAYNKIADLSKMIYDFVEGYAAK